MPAATPLSRMQCAMRQIGTARRLTLVLLGPIVGATVWLSFGSVAGLAVLVSLTASAALVPPHDPPARTPDPLTGLAGRAALVGILQGFLRTGARGRLHTGAIVIEIDRFKLIEERHDRPAIEAILRACADRICAVLRDSDRAARLEGPVFAIALAPSRRLDLEAAIQLSTRLQRALAEPLLVDGANLYLSASVGFALAQRLDRPEAEALLHAATLAMIEAGRSGPGAIRSYSGAMQHRVISRGNLSTEVGAALENGQIMAFFQPQLSTRTGAVTGFEALARWHHPDRGLIPPAEFLPALRQAGLMDRLGARMVTEALQALRTWEDAGHRVPRVGVNFSTEELIDPRLPERICWEIDRFGLTADRLAIEVLETVVAGGSDDAVVRNLMALARMGCALDLDDFGTGHAAITNIRRFDIGRIKIDRTFVSRIDADGEQQAMVSAILTMADRLGLETLAEGVETAGEQAMLARLGCGHVQGFGIARPMPMSEATAWLDALRDRAAAPVPLRRQAARGGGGA